jgi:hypothetical protein
MLCEDFVIERAQSLFDAYSENWGNKGIHLQLVLNMQLHVKIDGIKLTKIQQIGNLHK